MATVLELSCEEQMVSRNWKDVVKECLTKNNTKRNTPFENVGEMMDALKLFLKISIPIMLSFAFEVTIYPATVLFGGHLGATELAAIGLANSILMLIVAGTSYGLAQACDTYFAQVHGSKNFSYLTVVVQRSVVIFLLVSVLFGAVLLNFEQIFLLLGQDPLISYHAGNYLTLCIPCIPVVLWIKAFRNLCFVQDQRNYAVLMMILNTLVSGFFHFVLCYHTPLRMYGSVIAQNIGFIVSFGGFLWCAYRSDFSYYWTGWKTQLFDEWGEFFLLGGCGMMIGLMDIIPVQASVFLAGSYGQVDLDAQVIGVNFAELTYTILMGFGAAAAILIGGYLGAGHPTKARQAAYLNFVVTAFTVAAQSFLTIAFRYQIPRAFTSDEAVINRCADLIPSMTLFIGITGMNSSLRGVFRGSAQQATCTLILLISVYVISPIFVAFFMLYTDLRLKGLWLGAGIGSVFGFLANSYMVFFKFDFNALSVEAQERSNKCSAFSSEKVPLLEKPVPAPPKDRYLMKKRLLLTGAILAVFFAACLNRAFFTRSITSTDLNVTSEAITISWADE